MKFEKVFVLSAFICVHQRQKKILGNNIFPKNLKLLMRQYSNYYFIDASSYYMLAWK